MDITTVFGIILGAVLIVVSILLSGDLMNFFDPASIMIVIGGTLAAVIASYPLPTLLNTAKHFPKLLKGKDFEPQPVIEQLVEFAQIARKNGLLALEEKANELEDLFFKTGIMLVVDATEAEKVRSMLENEIAFMDARHEEEAGVYDKAAAFGPAFGMIGTLVGLINMLAGMDLSAGSSSSLGSSMSIAMVTTFYGCILANLIFMPIAKKLRVRNNEEVLYRQIIVEGVMGIQSGENPKNLKEKLSSMLPQKQKMRMLSAEGGEGGAEGGKKGKK